jgi:hypothetical protein
LHPIKGFPHICGKFWNCNFPSEVLQWDGIDSSNVPSFMKIINDQGFTEETTQVNIFDF